MLNGAKTMSGAFWPTTGLPIAKHALLPTMKSNYLLLAAHKAESAAIGLCTTSLASAGPTITTWAYSPTFSWIQIKRSDWSVKVYLWQRTFGALSAIVLMARISATWVHVAPYLEGY